MTDTTTPATPVLDEVRFEVSVEPATRDHYRLDWVPKPHLALAGMWIPAVVSDAGGRDFLGLRGLSDFLPGMTHTVSPFCGFRALQRNLVDDPPHLYAEYATHDWFEPFQYEETDEALTITYDSGRIVRDDAGCHWSDADGRWEIHGVTISDVFVVHVPPQPGIDHEVAYRHELLKATGTVDGTPVEGYFHQDYAYGPPGTTYTDLPIARVLEGMWVSWIHEHTDGTVGGGCFWQGRDDLDFGPGYVLRDGVTTAHDDVRTDLTCNDAGRPIELAVHVGGQTYDFRFDSVAGPLHVLGRLVSSTEGKEPARSWCWVEYADGMLSPEILDLMGERFRLARGR